MENDKSENEDLFLFFLKESKRHLIRPSEYNELSETCVVRLLSGRFCSKLSHACNCHFCSALTRVCYRRVSLSAGPFAGETFIIKVIKQPLSVHNLQRIPDNKSSADV